MSNKVYIEGQPFVYVSDSGLGHGVHIGDDYKDSEQEPQRIWVMYNDLPDLIAKLCAIRDGRELEKGDGQK